MRGISVVVPCYRSEATITDLVEHLAAVLPTLAPAYEILLVDDGSPDRTGATIDALAATRADVVAIHLARNGGQHAALLCGIRAARFELTVTMDDDLQHPPAQLPRLLAALTDDVDVVYGAAERGQHGVLRDIASAITKRVLQTTMGPTARRLSAFRVFRTRLRDGFASFSGPYVSIDVLLTWSTARFAHVFVAHQPRHAGTSGYTLRKLVTHAMTMLLLARPSYVMRSRPTGVPTTPAASG